MNLNLKKIQDYQSLVYVSLFTKQGKIFKNVQIVKIYTGYDQNNQIHVYCFVMDCNPVHFNQLSAIVMNIATETGS